MINMTLLDGTEVTKGMAVRIRTTDWRLIEGKLIGLFTDNFKVDALLVEGDLGQRWLLYGDNISTIRAAL